ncbi:hypothetical protein [Cellvibrio sp. NN19]|uniref:hypothetical protein n=1 Tax=Cellvibrio chitinivorans TaxID=3102792 RepID=UPI002B412E0F|nr:hypothetical protein [Cellvibrio sp. NN19]
MKFIKTCLLASIALLVTACTTTPEPAAQADDDVAYSLAALFGENIEVDEKTLAQHPLGSAENPVRVDGPMGQRIYLSRLVCDNNEQVSAFQRSGSAGIGPFGNIIDLYEVICDTNQGAVSHSVYLDMYHGDYKETRPAAGFIALKPEKTQ